jgi:diguanylate cyclase
MFGRTRPSELTPPATTEQVALVTSADMAVDTVGSILRILSEFPLDQEGMNASEFSALAERWAQHVLLALPAPTGPETALNSRDARRDWSAIREFVRTYCRGSSQHARTVTGDLRQVVWVFIQSLSRAFTTDQDTDSRLLTQLARLEQLTESADTADLKREVLATVVEVSQALEDRRRRQREQMDNLGAQVRTLGTELETAKRDGETDPLTQLYNRKAFDEHLQQTLQLFRAFDQPSCLLLIDVDRFKIINDTQGHIVGDEVLRGVADAITRVFLRKTDFVARYGGDEMAVILRDTSVREGKALAERLLKSLRAMKLSRNGVDLPVTATIGVAGLEAGFNDKGWIDSADKALLRAKAAGRDQFAVAGE